MGFSCAVHITLEEELTNHLTITLEVIIFPNYAFMFMLWELIVLTIQ